MINETTTFEYDTELPPVHVVILVCPGYMPVDVIGIPTLDFLADRGSRARWVGGNCGGTLLQAEYAPEPLFGVGRPDLAGPELTQRTLDHGAAFAKPYEAAGKRAAERLDAVAV